MSATNLVTNLDNRSSGNGIQPCNDALGNFATYESCFVTTDVQLSMTGMQYVLGIDHKESYFQHAVLLVQDLY